MQSDLLRHIRLGFGLLAALAPVAALAANKVSDVYTGVGSASSEYWSAYLEGANAVAGSLGDKKVHVVVSDFDGQKLLQQFGAVFSAGCDDCAVTADPASNAFTKAIVGRAADAGAKIVTLWNRPDEIHPWDTNADAWVAHVSFDGVDSGYQNGKQLCKALGGSGGVAVLLGIPDNPPAKQRLAGFNKAVAECPGLKVLDTQVGNWDQTAGQTITRTWLARFGGDLKGVFSENDGMALGAVAALREKGLAGTIPVTGSDGSSDVLRLIKSGDMLSSMFINGYAQGATAVALAAAAVNGDVDPAKLDHAKRDFYLSQTLVTKDNVDQVMNTKIDPTQFTYDKMKQNFWAYSVGPIPAGANK